MTDTPESTTKRKRLLNAGCGRLSNDRLPRSFGEAGWEQVKIDVDPEVEPDHVGSLTDMRGLFADRSFDAIWSSHSIEHLFLFELRAALGEFRRVLKPGGFALVTCPDLKAVAAALLSHDLDHTAYVSPAGPITLHDMVYGHTASIEAGATAMAHRTGLTAGQLGRLSIEAGFAQAIVGSGQKLDLWAVLCCPETDLAALRTLLAGTELMFLFSTGADGR